MSCVEDSCAEWGERDSVALGLEKQLETLDALVAVIPFLTFLLWLTNFWQIIRNWDRSGQIQGPQGILGDCWNSSFRHLGLLRNWCEYSLLVHRIYLPCLPNCFVHRKQEQGRWCSVVRLLGLVRVLLVDRNFPGIHPLLDSILLCLQARFLALGYVATDPWGQIPLRQFPERLFEEELGYPIAHRYSNGRSQEVRRYNRFWACGRSFRSGRQEGRLNLRNLEWNKFCRFEIDMWWFLEGFLFLVHIMFHRSGCNSL